MSMDLPVQQGIQRDLFWFHVKQNLGDTTGVEISIIAGLLNAEPLQAGNGVIVISAGGGTIDISGYVIEGRNPLQVAEIFASQCVYTLLSWISLDNIRPQVDYLGLLLSQGGLRSLQKVRQPLKRHIMSLTFPADHLKLSCFRIYQLHTSHTLPSNPHS